MTRPRPIDEVAVVVNPAAGGGGAAASATGVERLLAERGVRCQVVREGDVDGSRRALDELAASGTRTIIVGGDGMVHHAVNAFAGSDTVLGVVPAGTGNDFASAIGLPPGLDRAVTAALGPAGPIDLIRVMPADVYVATVATFGFSATVNERAERMRFPRGPSKYTVATLLEAARLDAAAIRTCADDSSAEREHWITLAAVANTAMFGGGMRIAPDADARDGLADVVFIGAVGRATLLRVLPRAFKGTHVEHHAVRVERLGRLRVEADIEMSVRGDGEPVGTLPAEFIAVPAAIQVAGATI